MNEYVYGSELEKAKAVMHEYHWWAKHANKTFTLPHKRSDTVVQLISDRVRKGRKTKSTIKNGNVYMLLSNMCEYKIPEFIDKIEHKIIKTLNNNKQNMINYNPNQVLMFTTAHDDYSEESSEESSHYD